MEFKHRFFVHVPQHHPGEAIAPIGREGGIEGMYPYLEAKTIILDQKAAKTS